jgi:hypothetical protein
LDEGHMWKSRRRFSHIRRLRVRHQDLVRLPFLLGQKGNRLGEDRASPAASNANHQIRLCSSGAQWPLVFHDSFCYRVECGFAIIVAQ